jgi:FkbM family methyltransferase
MSDDAGEEIAAREQFFRTAHMFSPYLGVETRWGTFVVRPDDSAVSRQLFVSHTRGEFSVLTRAVKALSRIYGRDVVADTTFVDVGANIGTTTVAALASHGFDRAVAIEPEPVNSSLLEANVAINGLTGRVTVVRSAVSDRDGRADLAIHEANRGAHELAAGRGLGSPFGATLDVPVARLDSLARRNLFDPRRVGLLWLDVQGHEGHVLAGASVVLRRGTPVLLEYYPAALEASGGSVPLRESARIGHTHFIDARRDTPRGPTDSALRPVEELAALAAELGAGHTDVLLVSLQGARRGRRLVGVGRRLGSRLRSG